MTLQDLGQIIRSKREASGLSIDDIAARIKVSARTLRAIEEGSTEGLPHAVYTKGFIRSFALIVGYDPEELNRDLEQVFPAEAFDDAKPEPGPINRSMPPPPGVGRKMFALLFFLVILAGVAAGGWYVATTYGDDILHMVKQPFSAVTTPVSPRGQTAAVKPEEGAKTTASAVLSQNQPSIANSSDTAVSSSLQASAARVPSPPPAVNATPKPEAAPAAMALPAAPASAGVNVSSAAAPATPATPQTERASATADGTNQIYIKAQQACWVSSRADGGRGRHLVVQPNENFVLTYSKNLELTLGNAGGVTITHNGVDLGPAGKPGQRVVMTFPR